MRTGQHLSTNRTAFCSFFAATLLIFPHTSTRPIAGSLVSTTNRVVIRSLSDQPNLHRQVDSHRRCMRRHPRSLLCFAGNRIASDTAAQILARHSEFTAHRSFQAYCFPRHLHDDQGEHAWLEAREKDCDIDRPYLSKRSCIEPEMVVRR